MVRVQIRYAMEKAGRKPNLYREASATWIRCRLPDMCWRVLANEPAGFRGIGKTRRSWSSKNPVTSF